MTRRLIFIDVLRGVAILTVLFHHLPHEFGQVFGRLQLLGGRGVDLFFVLSGFLIGSTCLARAESERGVWAQTGAYWVLRTARIWPLYLALLALLAIGVKGVNPEATRIVRDWPEYYLLFFSNDLAQPTLELGVLWSLAIEEQFYLAVGLVLPLASRSRAQLAGALAAMGVVAVLISVRTRFDLVTLHDRHVLDDGLFVYRTYHSTLARLDQLGLGLLTAVATSAFNGTAFARAARWGRASSWGVALATVLLLVFLPQFGPLEFAVVGVLFAAAVLWLQRPAVRALELGRLEQGVALALGKVGQLSFGLYLLHPFVRHGLLGVMRRMEWPHTPTNASLFLCAWIAVTFVLAALSYRWLETPVLSWARKTAERLMAPREQVPAVVRA